MHSDSVVLAYAAMSRAPQQDNPHTAIDRDMVSRKLVTLNEPSIPVHTAGESGYQDYGIATAH